MEQVPLHRMPGQVSDRPKPVRLDRPLDPLADRTRGHPRMHGLDRSLKCKLGGPDESGPVPRADLDRLGGVRDPTLLLRPQVQLGDVPRLRTFACFPERSTTDDSPPSGVAPPSMYRSTWSPSCSRAASHVRGAGCPCRFALVEVIGPMALASRRGIGCPGMRSATRPSLDTIGDGACAVARRTTVNGPGKFFAQNACAIGVGSPNRKMSAMSATAMDTGSSRGRDFAANRRSTAFSWNGSAPRP